MRSLEVATIPGKGNRSTIDRFWAVKDAQADRYLGNAPGLWVRGPRSTNIRVFVQRAQAETWIEGYREGYHDVAVRVREAL